MKRPKKYSHRPGMRFDRSHVQGPDAGFLGGEIEVTTFTGSVQRSVYQDPGTFRCESVPFAGYPRTPSEMSIACLGKGTWVDGYLCEELVGSSGITSSFDSTHTLFQTGSNVSYRSVGFRGPADDYALSFSATGALTKFTTNDPTRYAISSGSDLAFVWVARQSTAGGSRTFLNKYEGPAGGYNHSIGSTVTEIETNVFVVLHTIDFNDQTGGKGNLYAYLPHNQWYIGMIVMDKGSGTGSFTAINLETGRFENEQYQDIRTWTGSMDGIADGAKFSLGGYTTFSRNAPDLILSAIYIASGTNACSGMAGNERAILTNFAKILKARNGFLFSGSAEVDRSVASFGNAPESSYLTQKLLGLGTASLGRPRGISVITTGSIPSWTNAHIKNSAFVATPLSSSDHEAQVLGMWKSGSQALETSSVPASASMYYSKLGRYKNVIVKKSASVQDLTRLPSGMDGGTPVYYVPSKGTDISTLTGTLAYAPTIQYSIQRSSVIFPAMIPIDVNHQGKIVDIKVWVELMQTSGSTSSEGAGAYPLAGIGVAIRSPNVRGFHAHPIRNDEVLKKVFTSDLAEFTQASAFGAIGRSLFGPNYVTPFYRDSFILWEGPSVFGEGTSGPWDADSETHGGANFLTRKYPSWQRDRSMRTVFSDGAPIPNPRHHIGTSMSGNYAGSPNAGAGFANAYGFDVPWTSETEISGANTYAVAGSPPKGWLTGPGGSNLVNEWPTTGSNYGADYIKPLYPMLDPLYQRKRYGDLPRLPNTGSALFDPGKWIGYRPGLRGTEASGTWYVMLFDSRQNRNVGNYTPTYFRQVRLEFTLASGSYTDTNPRNQSSIAPRRAGQELLLAAISGSDLSYDATGSWDAHISDTYAYQTDGDVSSEVGRTFGIGLNTGSIDQTKYALIYRVTGTLADMSGSTPGWLLNNRFGMPVIPLSSASLVETVVEPVTSVNPQTILVDDKIVDSAVRITKAAQEVNPPTTRAEAYEAAIISLNEEEE